MRNWKLDSQTVWWFEGCESLREVSPGTSFYDAATRAVTCLVLLTETWFLTLGPSHKIQCVSPCRRSAEFLRYFGCLKDMNMDAFVRCVTPCISGYVAGFLFRRKKTGFPGWRLSSRMLEIHACSCKQTTKIKLPLLTSCANFLASGGSQSGNGVGWAKFFALSRAQQKLVASLSDICERLDMSFFAQLWVLDCSQPRINANLPNGGNIGNIMNPISPIAVLPSQGFRGLVRLRLGLKCLDLETGDVNHLNSGLKPRLVISRLSTCLNLCKFRFHLCLQLAASVRVSMINGSAQIKAEKHRGRQ